MGRTVLYVGPPASIHLRRWAQAAAEAGFNVVISGRGTAPSDQVFEPLPASYGRLGFLAALPALRQLIRSLRPDVVHAHFASSYGVLTVAATRGLRVPLVITCWGSDVLRAAGRSAFVRAATSAALRQADLVTAMSFEMAEGLIGDGVSPARLIVLPFGADLAVFSREPRVERLVDVVSTRALERQYRVDILLRALADARLRRLVGRVMIAGEGTQEKYLRSLAAALGLSSVVFAGRRDPAALAELLRGSRVFVSLASWDGNNISLNEAMAAGAFPVVTDNRSSREWITPGINGALTEVTATAVAASVGAALQDGRLRTRAALLNQTLVRECGSWSRQAAMMFKHYERLCESRDAATVCPHRRRD